MPVARVVTVGELNRYVRLLMERDEKLQGLCVRGEISNLTIYHRSGHCYFTLKDETAAVKCVLFKWNLEKLRFVPKEGMAVVVQGSPSVFEGTGNYQLQVVSLIPDGEGALAVAFAQLKERLGAEGLFDESHKKPIPPYPKKIVVITSATGAVLQDIKNVLSRRYPLVELLHIHSAVQGEKATRELCSALAYGDTLGSDCIIIGRGGGSAEDLWCFNHEELVRQIYHCNTPVISAVGHETDFTLCDFVSDLRAPTPSAAAELATPDGEELLRHLNRGQEQLLRQMDYLFQAKSTKIDQLDRQLVGNSPENRLKQNGEKLLQLKVQIQNSMEKKLQLKGAMLGGQSGILHSLSPLSTLERGYSYTTKDGEVVTTVEQVKVGEKLTLHLTDGTLQTEVTQKKKKRTPRKKEKE